MIEDGGKGSGPRGLGSRVSWSILANCFGERLCWVFAPQLSESRWRELGESVPVGWGWLLLG